MSHDERGHEKEPIILTSGRRFGKGLAIVVITVAVGAGILIPFFDEMFKNPPPVTQIRTERPPTPEPPVAGTTTIAILSGAATQGSPDYKPDDDATVPLGNKIVWDNQDSVPHTATSGIDNSDPEKGKMFDTGVINGGEKSKPIELAGAKEGDIINYFCFIHPYMTSKITIAAAGEGAQSGGAGAGPTINILEGASVQGSPDYDPDELTAKVGDEVTVINKDNVPHTVTSGTGSDDPNKGQAFDTNIMTAGQNAKISLAEVDPGQYDYFCIVHPYMTGKITIE